MCAASRVASSRPPLIFCHEVEVMETRVHAASARLPSIGRLHWPDGAYRRDGLPERVLQFGTGMLLRALSAASVDAANRAGAFNGRIVVVQSTPHGCAPALNAQNGLFTIVERGLENGTPVERTRLVGSISRALVADAQWPEVRELAARLEPGDAFRDWLSTRVHCCSSLVDRMTTGTPAADARSSVEATLGYSDELLTITEPHAFWAIEGPPDALRGAFAIDAAPG